MFKELILSIIIGILFGIFLFIRTQHALKNAYSHEIRSKYARLSHIASKYPELNDDIADEDENEKLSRDKFCKPLNYTDPLFNSKSLETEKLRTEFSKLFTILDQTRDFIMRDFIEYWYREGISKDDTKFINHIKLVIDGVFQILVNRISSTNWTYFIRDRIFHPLRECLTLYRNIVTDLRDKNPKWDELTETERDGFIGEVIEQKYQWHRGCDNEKSSIEYLRKWSLLFLEEILDERNFHCFAVRFFCRELLTNNILHPVLELVDGYNVNFGIVSGFIFLEAMNSDMTENNSDTTENKENINDKIVADLDDHEKKDDSNNMISMQDLTTVADSVTTTGLETLELTNDIECSESKSSIVTAQDQRQTEISMQPMEKKQDIIVRKRKRRASMDNFILKHYYKSFNISYFFIEINGNESELFELEPYEIKTGYSISDKYYIESQHKFTLRFVSKQCINLCARWVTVIGNNEILGDLSSLKHLQCIEYENNKYIYIWDDHKLHEYGSNYLQIGRQIIVSTDIQNGNKYHKIRHLFIPLQIPLIHIYFTANMLNDSMNNGLVSNSKKSLANSSISEGLAKFGSAINPLSMIDAIGDAIGDGVKKLLPDKQNPMSSPSGNIKASPESAKKKGLFGIKKRHNFHHDIDDIGFLPSNKDKKKRESKRDKCKSNNTKETDENKLKLLASHQPTTNLTIRIWDVYRDFDIKMNPYVAYVLRIRDEIINNDINNNNNNIQRIEWTIKTRFSKLHSFHRAIQRDKILRKKNIKIVAQFPAKSLITKMDAKYIAERRKQLVAYFNTLHRYPDVLLSNAVYELVIPPVLVDKYYKENIIINNTPSISEEKKENINNDENKNKKEENELFQHGFVVASHPVLQTYMKGDKSLKDIAESSSEISLPAVIGEGLFFDDDDDDIIDDYKMKNNSNMRPRRNSFPGCDAPNRLKIQPPLHGDLQVNKPRPKLSVFTDDMEEKKNIELIIEDDDDIDIIDDTIKKHKKHKKMEKDKNSAAERLQRLRIEHYEHLAPSLIKLIEAFLDLEKRSTFGSSLTIAATSILSWFFNGYIANKLKDTTSSLTMDGTLSYVMEWIRDLIWIPPTYQMDDEPTVSPDDEAMAKLRMEARESIVQMFELYIGDNVPKIIGQKKQLELCMIKFWRFMQQNKLLKHLSFSILDSLLQDLFPEKISRRYQRRAWQANKARLREETKRRVMEKEEKRREKEKLKRLKQQKLNQQKLKVKKLKAAASVANKDNIGNIGSNIKVDASKEEKKSDIINGKDIKTKSESTLLTDKKKKRIHNKLMQLNFPQKNGHNINNQKTQKIQKNQKLQKSPKIQKNPKKLQKPVHKSPSQNLQHTIRTRPLKSHSNKKHSQLKMKHNKPIIMNTSLRSKSRPMLMDDAPNIDIFGGGSLFSDYTKQFMKIGKKKEESSESYEDESSDDDDDSSTESDHENKKNDRYKNVRKAKSIGNVRKHIYKNDNNNNDNRGFFHKLAGMNRNKQNNKNVKDNQVKPEYWMH